MTTVCTFRLLHIIHVLPCILCYSIYAVTFTHHTVAPTIILAPVNATIIHPSNATFFCLASGLPLPDITWRFTTSEGVHPATSLRQIAIINSTVDERTMASTLVVYSHLYYGGIRLLCDASNSLGSSHAVAILTVYGELDII